MLGFDVDLIDNIACNVADHSVHTATQFEGYMPYSATIRDTESFNMWLYTCTLPHNRPQFTISL